MDWPADKIERRSVDALIPYARNARTHSDEQVAQIAASIKEWGWTTPVLVDEDGGIIAGHGRVMAARKLGIEEVPCMVATGWTKAQKQAEDAILRERCRQAARDFRLRRKNKITTLQDSLDHCRALCDAQACELTTLKAEVARMRAGQRK